MNQQTAQLLETVSKIGRWPDEYVIRFVMQPEGAALVRDDRTKFLSMIALARLDKGVSFQVRRLLATMTGMGWFIASDWVFDEVKKAAAVTGYQIELY